MLIQVSRSENKNSVCTPYIRMIVDDRRIWGGVAIDDLVFLRVQAKSIKKIKPVFVRV